MKIWISNLVNGCDEFPYNANFRISYIFYETLSSDHVYFAEKRKQLIPEAFEERRIATMLEF